MICLLLGLAIFLVAGGLFLRARYAAQSARQKAALQSAPQPVAAAAAQKGDLPVYLQCLGTVETSTSVVFAIAEDYVQEVVRKRDAGQPLPVEAFDRSFTQLCGTGALVGVDNRMDTETGTLKCKASLLPKGDHLMIPGLFLNLRLLLETRQGVVRVPTPAVQHDPQSAFVFVIRPDQTVTHRPVQVGAAADGWTEIQSGLAAGELIATSGFNGLAEGRRCLVRP